MRKKVINTYCPACRKRQTKLYKIGDRGITKILSSIKVCTNPKCSLYIDVKKVENWSRK